jgi:hypothetical protein
MPNPEKSTVSGAEQSNSTQFNMKQIAITTSLINLIISIFM